ncbi:hypothetical protein RB195_019959 [Necator americanus]|uniref:Uncharacterized protein n=1 Tax=Necator americanus TaxID=51031 RepID=A0ABR1CH77_NECAM
MYTASKQPSNLSQSALNYLQSLEKATKALRQNQQVEKKRVGGQHSLLESSRLSSERGSLSSMISQLRHRTRRESTIDEFDDSISEENGHVSERTPSISPSSAGGERIVFDFPFDVAKDDNKQSDALPKQLPGLQMGRKSIHEIRELRSSIDHSLIKPPKLQKQQPRRFSINSVNSYKEDSGSGQQEESEEEPEDVTPKPQAIKKKSPFRPAIESGSDLESIDFESATEGAISDASSESSTLRGSPEADKPSGDSRTSDEKRSRRVEEFDSSDEEEASTMKSGNSKAKQITVQSRKSVRSSGSDSPLSLAEDEHGAVGNAEKTSRQWSVDNQSRKSTSGVRKNVRASRKSAPKSAASTAVATPEQSDSRRSPPALEATPYTFPVEHSTQTEIFNGTERLPEFCSSNLHHVTRDVLRTHLQLLKEFNRLEFSSLQEWNAILDDVRQKYDGPSTEKLKAVLEKRAKNLGMDRMVEETLF